MFVGLVIKLKTHHYLSYSKINAIMDAKNGISFKITSVLNVIPIVMNALSGQKNAQAVLKENFFLEILV